MKCFFLNAVNLVVLVAASFAVAWLVYQLVVGFVLVGFALVGVLMG